MWPFRRTSRHRRAWQRLIGVPLLLCALVTTGCTTAFFYNRLDTFAGWYFESLVSLNDVQRTELRGWLERTLAEDIEALLFVRLYRSLGALVGNDADARMWLRDENLALGARPLELIRGAEGMVRVLQYLDASRGRG